MKGEGEIGIYTLSTLRQRDFPEIPLRISKWQILGTNSLKVAMKSRKIETNGLYNKILFVSLQDSNFGVYS